MSFSKKFIKAATEVAEPRTIKVLCPAGEKTYTIENPMFFRDHCYDLTWDLENLTGSGVTYEVGEGVFTIHFATPLEKECVLFIVDAGVVR